ncbi:MAG TPA: glycoside hydrolase family 3 N-terminal domain-containing protein [Vicinamibacterales bacterium]|nr:glycoside hydrolase family 3 N-terminal domain-containing protein [Vicinamibacterales bacterium]
MARVRRHAALVLRTAVLVASVPLLASAPALDRDAARWVKRTLEQMTLDERIGQMLVPELASTYLPTDSDAFEELARRVRDQHVGGFIAFGGAQPTPGVLLNPGYAAATLGQPLAAASTFNRLQELSSVPLLNSADFETGVGMRIAGATVFPRAMAFGATGDVRLAAEAARITALEGRAIGVHVNLAPVADVNSNPRNPIINTRAFGGTPAHVSAMVASYVRSLEEHGMVATLKHFPGHGDTDVDSHLGLPVISQPRARLDEIELPPFRTGIEAGAGAVMTSHIALPALDPAPDTPATFSQPIVTSLLRRDLAFGGLIVTDSMEMQGITRLLSPGEAAVRAIQAGHDMLIDLRDTPAAFAAIKAAVHSGSLTDARITVSAERILRMKASLGLHKQKQVALEDVPRVVGGRAHRAVAQVVSERSITLLKDERNTVPLRLPADASILYLSVLDYPAGWSIGAPSRTLAPELRKRWPRLMAVELSDRSTAAELDLVQATTDRYEAIVAAVFVRTAAYSGRMDLAPALTRLLNDLARRTRAANTPFVAILFGNPYVATFLPELPAMVLTYDYYDLAEGSAARAIAGEAPIGGRLPVALPGLFPIGHGLVRRPGL